MARRPCYSTLLSGVSLAILANCGGWTSETHMVEMRDGVRLATTSFVPNDHEGQEQFPALLFRTPYSRELYHPRVEALTASGIAVVVQDTRGRFDSEGEDLVFTSDGDGQLQDGYDTIAWLVDQPWSNGRIATAGNSADAIVQYLTAPTAPPGLAFMYVEFGSGNLYDDLLFQGGVRRYALTHNWLKDQGSLKFEAQFAAHPFNDDFWRSSQTRDRYAAVQTPSLHIGGWFDIALQGTIDAFTGYQYQGGEGARGQQKLVLGPWTHARLWQHRQGELRFPENARRPPESKLFDIMVNHYLELDHASIEGTPDNIPTVQYYMMGDVDDPSAPGNIWVTREDWPPPAARLRMHLQADGSLQEGCPSDEVATSDYLSYPLDPIPTRCGNNLLIDAGPCDQREIEARPDQVIFQTLPLEAPLEITGRVRARLFVDIDRPDTDLMVRLTDVYPDGRSMLIADGALRLGHRLGTQALHPVEPGEVVEASVDLWSTSIVLNQGHRLRMAVASTNWPRFAVNRNHGRSYPESMSGEALPVAVRVHHNLRHASYLEIPSPPSLGQAVRHCPPE